MAVKMSWMQAIRTPRACLLTVLIGLSPAPAFAAGPSATDALGRKVALDAPAARIVSLSPAATEILFAIGAGDRVVGVTEYCDYPEEAMKRPKVGGFSGATVSVERIIALKADLVLVSGEMHGRLVSLLDSVGLRSFALEPRTFAEVYADILTVGSLTGCEAGAAAVVKSMRKRIEAVMAATVGEPRPSVFWELWYDPLMSAGGPTFVTEAIAAAGGRNSFGDLSERWPLVSFEELLARDPDWILVGSGVGMGVDSSSVGHRPLWSKLRAVRQGRVANIEADLVGRGGPRLADAVEAIARALGTRPLGTRSGGARDQVRR